MADETANLTLKILERLQADMTGLRGEVGGLRGEVAELRNEVGEIRNEVGELRGEVREVQLDVVNLRSEMRAGFARVDREFETVRDRISRLDADTAAGFALIRQELVHHRTWAVDKLRNHEDRITALERAGEPPRAP